MQSALHFVIAKQMIHLYLFKYNNPDALLWFDFTLINGAGINKILGRIYTTAPSTSDIEEFIASAAVNDFRVIMLVPDVEQIPEKYQTICQEYSLQYAQHEYSKMQKVIEYLQTQYTEDPEQLNIPICNFTAQCIIIWLLQYHKNAVIITTNLQFWVNLANNMGIYPIVGYNKTASLNICTPGTPHAGFSVSDNYDIKAQVQLYNYYKDVSPCFRALKHMGVARKVKVCEVDAYKELVKLKVPTLVLSQHQRSFQQQRYYSKMAQWSSQVRPGFKQILCMPQLDLPSYLLGIATTYERDVKVLVDTTQERSRVMLRLMSKQSAADVQQLANWQKNKVAMHNQSVEPELEKFRVYPYQKDMHEKLNKNMFGAIANASEVAWWSKYYDLRLLQKQGKNLDDVAHTLPMPVSKLQIHAYGDLQITECDVIWNMHFAELKQYVKKHKVLPMHSTALGRWARKQRAACANVEKIKRLNSLQCKLLSSWQKKLILLESYVKTNKRLPQQGYKVNGFNLSDWMYQELEFSRAAAIQEIIDLVKN